MSGTSSGSAGALPRPGPRQAQTLPSRAGYTPPLKRIHAALLRRLHLFTEHTAAVLGPPDGTGGKHELAELTIAGDNAAAGVHFLSTPWRVLRWVHRAAIPDAERAEWVFVDLGAGKGRAVLSAAQESYRRVLGVEFAAELAAAARSNVDAAGHDQARVEIVEGDAAAFSFPSQPCLLFLFNPFGPPVLDRVAARVAEAARAGRRIRVAYLNPEHAAVFDALPCLRRVELPRAQRLRFQLLSPYRLVIYEALPAGP